MSRFSPSLLAPDRSSPSSRMTGSPTPRGLAEKALPSACTTPLVPSVNSYRQPRSRSRLGAERLNNPPPPPAGRAFQFRFTRSMPVEEPCLVSDTDGADLVRVTLDSETGADGAGAACGSGVAGVFGRLV